MRAVCGVRRAQSVAAQLDGARAFAERDDVVCVVHDRVVLAQPLLTENEVEVIVHVNNESAYSKSMRLYLN